MLDAIKSLWNPKAVEADLQKRLEEMRKRTPVPVFWLFGKTQSGKTSIIKFLTGADEAEIGHGFQPCTRYSRQYLFPTPEAPLLAFLDTRGMDEPGYDPAEDIARFNAEAHVVVVTAKVMDHAQINVLNSLRRIRDAAPNRPVVLVPTCLHEAYPQVQHPQPYPFDPAGPKTQVPEELARSLEEQQRRFGGLADEVVPIDLTKPEEGYDDPNYGGERLKQVLLDLLPQAYRQTLLTLDLATRELSDLHARHALPYILGYAGLAATAGAFPIPFLDLLVIPAVQSQMVHHLARFYGQPLTGTRFAELAGTLGLGVVARQATREFAKVIPYVGHIAAATLAGASTFALGKAFCYYYSAVHHGHVPKAEDLKRYYDEQLAAAEKLWKENRGRPPGAGSGEVWAAREPSANGDGR